MSSVILEHDAPVAVSRTGRPGWLVGPWFDALFIANIAWPLLVLLQFSEGFAGRAGVEFWQLYFITTPHRWITLFIVFLDRDRFAERRTTFLALAGIAAAVCLGVRTITGALTCLLTIDYLWNAWHFASQHHGIYRIYGRRAGTAPVSGLLLEKWGMRLFLLYVTLRVVTATWTDLSLETYFQIADVLALAVPAWLVLREIFQASAISLGRLTYLLSVLVLYSSLLWAVHERRPALILALATASALFHALEYLAIVSWSVRERHAISGERMGVMNHLVPRWGIALAVFVVVLGAGAWWAQTRFLEYWLLVNVIVAYLHYAYDGLIWRRRATA